VFLLQYDLQAPKYERWVGPFGGFRGIATQQ